MITVVLLEGWADPLSEELEAVRTFRIGVSIPRSAVRCRMVMGNFHDRLREPLCGIVAMQLRHP